MNSITHHGVKGMHWGVRKDEFSRSVNKAMGSFLGIENKHLNKMLRSSGKLRKAYFEAQSLGVKTKNGKYQYNKESKELYQKQQAAARKAQKYAKDFLEKYKTKPMSYLESLNAQRGAAIGTAVGIAVPVVLPLWATIPAGYYIGSHVGGSSIKHYGVKGMKWKQHRMARDNNKPGLGDWLTSLATGAADTFESNTSSAADRANRSANNAERLLNEGHPLAAARTLMNTYRNDPDARRLMEGQVNTLIENLTNGEYAINGQSSFATRFTGGVANAAFNLFNNTIGASSGSRGRRPAGERRKIAISQGRVRGRRKRASQ